MRVYAFRQASLIDFVPSSFLVAVKALLSRPQRPARTKPGVLWCIAHIRRHGHVGHIWGHGHFPHIWGHGHIAHIWRYRHIRWHGHIWHIWRHGHIWHKRKWKWRLCLAATTAAHHFSHDFLWIKLTPKFILFMAVCRPGKLIKPVIEIITNIGTGCTPRLFFKLVKI